MQDRDTQIESFFDTDFYLEQIDGECSKDPLQHYLEDGWKEGLDPSPEFSTVFYLSKHPDVRKSGMNPLEHFVRHGVIEGREIRNSKRIDPAALVLSKSTEIKISVARMILRALPPSRQQSSSAKMSKLSDYLETGWRQREVPRTAHVGEYEHSSKMVMCPLSHEEKICILLECEKYCSDKTIFASLTNIADHWWYEKRCEALGLATPTEVEMDIATHYLAIGRYFRLSITPIFDVAQYIDSLQDYNGTSVAPEDALIHYITVGEAEGLQPCGFFNPSYYSARYGIVGTGLLEHFVCSGSDLGYQPSAAFWSNWYENTYKIEPTNLLAHFYVVGINEGFTPNPLIDLEWYRTENNLKSRNHALVHYVFNGFKADFSPHRLINPDYIRKQQHNTPLSLLETSVEFYLRNPREVDPCPLFDTKYYLSQLADTGEIEQPLAHYLDRDVGGPKCPNPFFFDRSYLLQRRDVHEAKVSPLVHYLSGGFREIISVHPLVDADHLKVTISHSEGSTPLEAIITGKAGETVELRKRELHPDTVNRSKWLPIALNIDEASNAYDGTLVQSVNVGILAHVFYVDLLHEVIAFAQCVRQPSILLISTDSFSKKNAIVAALKEASLENWEVRVIENRGRDIAPSFFGFADCLETLDYAVHIHTKRSRHYGKSFDEWRNYLFSENGGSSARVDAILRMFEANATLGALAPADFGPVRPLISWGHNRKMSEALLLLAGHSISLADISLEFPSGSMFWFRVKALRGLFRAGLHRFHFEAEAGQVDGTLAHAIERAFFMLVETEGYDWARFCSGKQLFGYHVTDDIKFARSRILPPLVKNDPVVAKIPETRSFFCRALDNPCPRLNLLIPTADQKLGYAGVSEAIRQFRAIGKKLGPNVELRIISTDLPFTNMTIPPTGFSISNSLVDERNMAVVPGFLRGSEPLGLRKNDMFVASAWWTAKQAYELMDAQDEIFGGNSNRRMVYLIQDFEPGFYPWSTRWALAENTYRHPDRTIAVFNTPLLADFMTSRYAFSAIQTFRPMINEDLLIPTEKQLPAAERDKVVLLYARPHAERNSLEIIDAIVFHCIKDAPEFWAGWRFLAVGETFESNVLLCDRIEVLGRLSLEDYRVHLGKSRLGISIMISPHPSYPPLEMAANGMKVLTNTYDGKDLSKLHKNLESFTMFDPATLAQRLKAMAESSTGLGKPLVDWFFDGRNNLDSVAEAVAAELRSTLGLGLAVQNS